jgi:hypothetical protein
MLSFILCLLSERFLYCLLMPLLRLGHHITGLCAQHTSQRLVRIRPLAELTKPK